MHIGCPHCSKELKLSDTAVASLQKLPAGKTLKVKCVHCGQGFFLDNSQKEMMLDGAIRSGKKETLSTVRPPLPPDVSWLRQKELSAKQKTDGVSRALLLIPNEELKDIFFREISAMEYCVEVAATTDDALAKITHDHYQLIVCHSSHDEGGFSSSALHRYLCYLPIVKRRKVFYVLVGPELKTLYQLQALSFSANLVINDSEVEYIGKFLQKAMADYRQFLKPLLTELDQIKE